MLGSMYLCLMFQIWNTLQNQSGKSLFSHLNMLARCFLFAPLQAWRKRQRPTKSVTVFGNTQKNALHTGWFFHLHSEPLVSFWTWYLGLHYMGSFFAVCQTCQIPCFHWLEINVKDLVQFGLIMIPHFFGIASNSNSLGNYTSIFGVYIPQYTVWAHFVTLCFCDPKSNFSLWECVRIPLVCLKFPTIHISSSNLLLSLLNIIQHVNKICECTIPLPEIG